MVNIFLARNEAARVDPPEIYNWRVYLISIAVTPLANWMRLI
jgi:hypothetical protein